MNEIEKPHTSDGEKSSSIEKESKDLISKGVLTKIFSSEQFNSRIEYIISKMQEKEGREHGFVVLRDNNGDEEYFSEVVGGQHINETNLSSATAELHDKICRQKEYDDHFTVLPTIITFHTHPIIAGDSAIFVAPSDLDIQAGADTRQSNGNSGYDYPPIEMVGMRIGNGDALSVLVYQEPSNYRMCDQKYMLEELSETLLDTEGFTQQDVLELLKHYQYKVLLVRFSDGRFSDEDVKEMASTFAYKPSSVAD